MNSCYNVTSAAFDVAISFAAAVTDCSCYIAKTSEQASVHTVEAIAQTIGDAAQLCIYILVVETFEKVGASDCTLYCRIRAVAVAAIAKESAITKDCKPYKIDEPFVTG